ncbi:MAG: hypothetical protein M3Y54_08715 [Bacteroidota bacterium]|nr:hypothetical protein [Bacteroidota bacterium]
MKRPPLPYLFLLPLLAVLLFGNCGSGVRGFLNNMGSGRRARFSAIIARRLADRHTARLRLRGEARREDYVRIEQATNARLDSLLPDAMDQRKLRNRRNKIERQLRRLPPSATSLK